MNVNDHRNKLKRFNFNRYSDIDLTNLRYVLLLNFILKSERPLTSYEIQRGIGGSKYIHEMLHNLYTPSRRLQHLFIWDKIGTSDIGDKSDTKKKLYRLLNYAYKLEWFNETPEQYKNLTIARDDKFITLSFGTKKLEIRLIENEEEGRANRKVGEAVLNIYDDKKRFPYHNVNNKRNYPYFLETLRNKSGLHVYVETYYNPGTVQSYLDVEYNLEVDTRDANAKKLYSGNFRGFLLYLAGEFRHGWTQEGKLRIYDDISNPSLIKKVPFLKYWKDFEAVGFDVLGLLKEIIADFNYIIKQHYKNYAHNYNIYAYDHSPVIGMNDRDTSDDNIKLIIIERYHAAVFNYFADFECPTPFVFPKENINYENLKITDKLKNYNLEMLNIQRNLLVQRQNRIEESINHGLPIYPVKWP